MTVIIIINFRIRQTHITALFCFASKTKTVTATKHLGAQPTSKWRSHWVASANQCSVPSANVATTSLVVSLAATCRVATRCASSALSGIAPSSVRCAGGGVARPYLTMAWWTWSGSWSPRDNESQLLRCPRKWINSVSCVKSLVFSWKELCLFLNVFYWWNLTGGAN